jgi:hypothetical protein
MDILGAHRLADEPAPGDYLFFFLCLSLRSLFFRLCVAIFFFFLFLPHPM